MKRHDDDGIIGSRPVRDETADLPLFAPPVRARAEGAGQRARRNARQSTDRNAGMLRVQEALRDATEGLTRLELHRATGLPIGTINARVADLRALALAYTRGTRITYQDGREVEESVVFLQHRGAA